MSDSVAINLGKRIRELREARGLTQNELAALTSKSVETISNFERGKTVPSIRSLNQMAMRINCSMEDFFDKDSPLQKSELEDTIAIKSRLLADRDKVIVMELIKLMTNQSE